LISDKEQRLRAIEDMDHSFVVEASAGTGKTSILINRILRLVLEKGPEGKPLPISRVCAITFTEKAAGEMKIRLRHYFEEVATGHPVLDSFPLNLSGKGAHVSLSMLRDRAREALNDLERASISTFHAFAVSLLKERPVEAGLDPRFSALDELQSELFFRKSWESWIGRAVLERKPMLELALRNGFLLKNLEDLARILRLHWLTVRDPECDSPPREAQLLGKIQEFLVEGRGLLGRLLEPKDKLAAYLNRTLNWLGNPDSDAGELLKPGKAGAAANWEGGAETVQNVQRYVRDVVKFSIACKSMPAQQLLRDIVHWIKEDFLKGEYESRKRLQGLLDFDDQIWLARELLRKNKAVRREFQARYATLLVDEFQDTDSVQWDIVRLLVSTDLEETDPGRLKPAPGRLFIVGDPKQSIYRFRYADIETYLGIVGRRSLNELGLDLLQLTMNFRSVPSILRFVDAAFKGCMKAPPDGCYQPDYLPFGDHGRRTEQLHDSTVNLLGDRANGSNSGTSAREFLELEASRIARLIRKMHGSEFWRVQDRGSSEGGDWRMPKYGDIAILLPVLSHADILEEALRELEIPFVLEGGKFYYARSEVSSAITVLRAVANPNDSVALYGALRSIFFGLSDVDLLKARMEQTCLDYREKVSRESPLYYPFEVLGDLHQHRHERRASESLEILLQKTGAREVLATRGFQSLANLNKLVRMLRFLQGESTFSQVVDLLQTMDEEALAESESRLMEEQSDAVRILSIHKSKGLDFPIVFVSGLGLKRRVRSKNLLMDPRQKRVFAIRAALRESSLTTPNWEKFAEEEKKREDAELIRLLYVGLTRARDHLILSTHTQDWKQIEEANQWIPNMDGTRLAPLSAFLEKCFLENNSLAGHINVNDLDRMTPPRKPAFSSGKKDWSAIVKHEFQELRSLLDNTPSASNIYAAGKRGGAFQSEDRPPDAGSPEVAENMSIRLGVAFHDAMETVDLASAADSVEGLAEYMREIGMRHMLNQDGMVELEDMVRTSLSSELIRRARAAMLAGGRVLKEVNYVRPLADSAIEEGKIDMLFEEEAGWILVDYKTDRIFEKTGEIDEFYSKKYAGQIQNYVEALRNFSVRVQAAYLLLSRSGHAIRVI
jgi:ATP-dependent helicase/nuclease subunit A